MLFRIEKDPYLARGSAEIVASLNPQNSEGLWWHQHLLGVRQALVEDFLELNYEDDIATQIPRADYLLSVSRFNQGEYRSGNFMISAAYILEQILADPKLQKNEKYQIALRAIRALSISYQNIIYELLWSRIVVQLVIKYKQVFNQDQYQQLLGEIFESPISWSLLMPFPKLEPSVESTQLASFMFLFSHVGITFNSWSFDQSGIIQRYGYDNIARVFAVVQANHAEPSLILEEMLSHPQFRPGGDRQQMAQWFIAQFINSQTIIPYF